MKLGRLVIAWVWIACGGCNLDQNLLARVDAGPGAGGGGGSGGNAGGSAGNAGSSAQGGAGGTAAGGGAVGGTGGVGGAIVVPTARYLFIFYTPHGTVLDAWRPSGGSGNLTFGPILKPLERYQDRITVIEGLDNVSAPGAPSVTHVDGPTTLLTARKAGGPSIDQLFSTPHAQVVATVDSRITLGSTSPQDINYAQASSSGIKGTSNPSALQSALFGAIDPALSSPDGAVHRTFVNIFAEAFRRDIVRGGTLIWSTVDGAVDVAGTGGTLRELAEASATSPAREQFITQQTRFAEEFANVISVFEGIELAPGTSLLDRSAILWISETGEAATHAGREIPVVVAGSLGGRLRQGQYLHYINRTQGDLMLTLASALGVVQFGDPAIAAAPLGELLAP